MNKDETRLRAFAETYGLKFEYVENYCRDIFPTVFFGEKSSIEIFGLLNCLGFSSIPLYPGFYLFRNSRVKQRPMQPNVFIRGEWFWCDINKRTIIIRDTQSD